MTASRFRFRPPPIDESGALVDALSLAFSPHAEVANGVEEALELADRLALLPRIAARGDLRLEEAAGHTADRLRRERSRAAAADLRFDETLAEVAEAAHSLGCQLAVLKGRALALAGHAAPGSRPSSDIDLLAESAAVGPLAAELCRRGFTSGQSGYEHHAPALARAGGATVELHRHLPGVRLGRGRRSADWQALADAGVLRPIRARPDLRGVLVPTRELLTAHALVHGLAQHGLHAAYPGWLLVADLVDLGFASAIGAGDTTAWRAWIATELSDREIDAACALASYVAEGGNPLVNDAPPDSRALARHFVACALDPAYGESLKLRWLEAPVTDSPRTWARLRIALSALVPPAETAESRLRRAGRWLVRPLVLAARAGRAVRAAWRRSEP